MTIAEELMRVGEARGVALGEARGDVCGRIRLSQELLGLPVSDQRDLSQTDLPELRQLLSRLEDQLRSRFHLDSANSKKVGG